jgi:hypothetical protein
MTNNGKESFAKWLKTQNVDRSAEKNVSVGSTIGITPALIELARGELKRMLTLPGNYEPNRGDLDDPKITWRHEKPNYTIANLAFLKGKMMDHENASLEMVVENAVKTWEMEASHKIDTDQWKTIVHDEYRVQANGKKTFKLDEAAARGNYNVLMDHIDKNLYDAEKENFETSHYLFQHAFTCSFPWEVLDVYAGPPTITFLWRHWGEFTGIYKDNIGEGQIVEMRGYAAVSVTPDLKITSIKVFYKPENFLRALQGKKIENDSNAKEIAELESLMKSCKIEASKEIRETTSDDFKMCINGDDVTGSIDDVDNDLMNSFPWNVTEVFSDAPEIAFTWRHQEKDEKIEGFAIINFDEKSKINCINIFYKPIELPEIQLEGIKKCPFTKN